MGKRIYNQGGRSASALEVKKDAVGSYIEFGAWKMYSLTAAVTANVTTTTAAAGSLAKTSHATGQGSIFRSDGSKWQFLTNA
jgi:hypothetical protein